MGRRRGRPGRARQRRAGLAAAQGARLRAAGRARAGARRRPGAQDARRRRPDRVSERREVLIDRGDERGPPQDRRLPVHHARAAPGGRPRRRRRAVHRRGRPGADPGRQRGPGAGAGVPSPRRALLGARPRDRLRDARARPRPAHRPRRDRGRTRRVPHRPGRAPAPGRAQQGRRAAGAGAGRSRRCPTCRRAGCERSRSSAATHEGLRSLVFALADARRARPRGPARVRRRPASCCARARSTMREFDVSARRRGLRGERRQARALGAADRLQQRRGRGLPRRPARPARGGGGPGCARAPSPAPRSESAHVSFDWDPATPAGAGRVHGPRGSDARLAPAPHRRQRAATGSDDAGGEAPL